METRIPFQGFYNSIHDNSLDSALESILSDNNGDPYPSLLDKAYSVIDWKKVHTEYAKYYAEGFALHFEIDLKFESLYSPKEYNFSTDTIYCEISLDEVKRILFLTDMQKLSQRVKNTFTSYSGFISHYSNSLEAWGEVETWDHNQLGALIEEYINKDEPFDSMAEIKCISDDFDSPYQILLQNFDNPRLLNIADYLRQREYRA